MINGKQQILESYELLGIRIGANLDEVKKAYREKARKYHPDQYANNDLQHLAEREMQRVNLAYEAVLTHIENEPVEALYEAVENQIDNKNFTEAERLMGTIQAKDTRWHVYMAFMMYKRGSWNPMLTYIASARRLAGPGDNEWLQILEGILTQYMNNIDDAIDNNDFMKAEAMLNAIRDRDIRWYAYRAALMRKKGSLELMLECIVAARKLTTPDDKEWLQVFDGLMGAYYEGITEAFKNENLARAEKLLSAISERDAIWYFFNAILMSKKGFYDAALTSINEAQRLEPDNHHIKDFKEKIISAQKAYKANHKAATSGSSDSCSDLCGCLCCLCSALDCVC